MLRKNKQFKYHKLLTSLLVVFIIVGFAVFGFGIGHVLAENKGPCGGAKGAPVCPSGYTVRMQVGIPYVTDSCTYTADYYDFDTNEMVTKTKSMHCVKDFPTYIAGIYKFFISIVGILAVVVMMMGGFQWLLAVGNAQKISGAKTTIISAIMGLVLALGSYTILSWINPNILELRLKVHDVDLQQGSTVSRFCKKGDEFIPPLGPNDVPECGKRYLLKKINAETGEDEYCAGFVCSINNFCFSGGCQNYVVFNNINYSYHYHGAFAGKFVCGNLYDFDRMASSSESDRKEGEDSLGFSCPSSKEYCNVDVNKLKVVNKPGQEDINILTIKYKYIGTIEGATCESW